MRSSKIAPIMHLHSFTKRHACHNNMPWKSTAVIGHGQPVGTYMMRMLNFVFFSHQSGQWSLHSLTKPLDDAVEYLNHTFTFLDLNICHRLSLQRLLINQPTSSECWWIFIIIMHLTKLCKWVGSRCHPSKYIFHGVYLMVSSVRISEIY